MDLPTKYQECCTLFYTYLIENKLVNKKKLFLLLQNDLRESIDKSKMNTCRSILKSGTRTGQECGKKIKNDDMYCKVHSKKEKPTKIFLEEDENVLVIKKNKFNNFVYGNTGLIFKSSLEKYIVAKEGMNGEWLPLDDIDIEMCKEYNLKWKIIQNKVRGEKTNIDLIKKHDLFPTKKEVENDKTKRHFKYLEEEFHEN